MSRNKSFYKEHPQTCERTDFWGQVKRTVNGKPLPQKHIDMIVDTISSNLQVSGNDTILDFCCGNGALSTLVFAKGKEGLGADYSEYLIGVADEFFATPKHIYKHVEDVADYVLEEQTPERFTVAFCYGSFQYLEKATAASFLKNVRQRFVNIRKLFIGNLPDEETRLQFYSKSRTPPEPADAHDSAIGVWRSRTEFEELAIGAGWDVSFSKMPKDFYASPYRYDALLTPKDRTGA